MSSKIHLLSLSASTNSVSRACVPATKDVFEGLGHTTVITDIRDYPPVWVDSSSPENYDPKYSSLFQDLEKADGYVLFLPIHTYTVSSTAKVFTEILFTPLKKKPVAFVTAAGGKNSFLAVRDLMASLIFDSQSLIYPIHVNITESDLNQNFLPNEIFEKRLESLAQGFANFVEAVKPLAGT